MSATHEHPDPTADPTAFWEDRYRDSDRIWSGNPNPLLVREATDLSPGTALDLGCGEGADAVWLADRGWQVTGVDIAQVALERAAAHAADAGVADRITWQRHVLGETFPSGAYDLVSAQFLQSPVALDTDGVLRRAAEAVTPGGTLLVVMHAGWPSWASEEDHPFHAVFPTLQEVLDVLALGDDWRLEVCEAVEKPSVSPDGEPGTRADNVWRATRLR